jgi:hypothetical protein
MTLNRWIAIWIAFAVLAFPTLSLADHHEAGEAAAEHGDEGTEGGSEEASGDGDDEGSEGDDQDENESED